MRLRSLASMSVLIVLAAQLGNAQEKAAVGSKAPGFTLQDQNGKSRTLDELVKESNVALAFHRSADW